VTRLAKNPEPSRLGQRMLGAAAPAEATSQVSSDFGVDRIAPKRCYGAVAAPMQSCVARREEPRAPEHRSRYPNADVYLIEEATSLRIILTGFTPIRVPTFGHLLDYLDLKPSTAPACVIAPLSSAAALPDKLFQNLFGSPLRPAIAIDAHGDIRTAVRAMRCGAIDVLTHPVEAGDVIVRIGTALALAAERYALDSARRILQNRFSTLTPREREVLPLVTSGMRNKQAAAQLGISEVTLQVHRSQVMKKTAVRSFAELVRLSLALGIVT
jgi:FixJ family two-component response regulator